MEVFEALVNSWPLVALVLGIVALVLFRAPLLLFLHRADEVGVAGIKISAKAQGQHQLDAPLQISKVEELSKAMQSSMLTEVEEGLKKNLDVLTKNPEEREKMLLKLLSVNQISVAFERVYHSIFGSQLAALQFLVSSSSGLEDTGSLAPFYEQAKSKNPEFYDSYSFENWLSFLQSNLLIVYQNQKIGITVRGKEFLKYLIDQNYTINRNG